MRGFTALLVASLLGCNAAPADGGEASDGSGGACGVDPTPPGAASCPAECTGGCNDGTCTIACQDTAVCNDRTITCPPDYACQLICDGGDACDSSTVVCPADYACAITCVQGTDACGDLEVQCGSASSCDIDCAAVPTVCIGAVLQCGSGACAASCAGESKADVTCNDACACERCS
ncbi:MAG: hypothetical protein K1X88_03755 [Nannocystaceae bacterium]|nr:hypothetical protein [Nannocystaceae bacterium]